MAIQPGDGLADASQSSESSELLTSDTDSGSTQESSNLESREVSSSESGGEESLSSVAG